MHTPSPTRPQGLLSWAPNLLILSLLGALGYWGHAHHWTLPKFSQLQQTAAAADGAKSVGGEDGPKEADRAARSIPGHLPTIEFVSAEAARNCGIELGIADRRSMDDYVVANGVVDYDQTRFAQLSARAPGIVWRVEKLVGDTVKRGDVLEIVDAADVGRAKAELLEAAVLYKLKTITLQRLKDIQSSVAAREIREAEAGWELARVQRFNALQTLVNLGLPIRQEEIARLSTDELVNRLHFLGLPQSLIDTLDHETTSANLVPLVAPFDGVIIQCDVVRGETVEPAKPQYVMADVSRMWIRLDIRQEHADHIRLGAQVVFNSEGDGPPVSSTLSWIGTEIDPRTRTIQARAEVVNPPLDDETSHEYTARRLLHANAFGSVHISVRSNPQAVVIPNDAIRWQWEIGRQVVFVPRDGGRQFEPRVVHKGLSRNGYVQIVDGLEAGEQVVVSGSRILSSELSDELQRELGDNSQASRDFSGAP